MDLNDISVCPHCGVALLVDAPANLISGWPDIVARFRCVGMHGGWECLRLDGSVPVDSEAGSECDAVYVGDLITPDIECPYCHGAIYDVLKNR
jgi:DNA-directed RNA polymerase subunit RPC12/RpoP